MEHKARYQVVCQLTMAELRYGRVVGQRQVEQHVLSDTYEVNELFVDLCAYFRHPRLLGLQIISVRRLQARTFLRKLAQLPLLSPSTAPVFARS